MVIVTAASSFLGNWLLSLLLLPFLVMVVVTAASPCLGDGCCHCCSSGVSLLVIVIFYVPQHNTLLPFLLMVGVTGAAAVCACHSRLSHATVQYTSHYRLLLHLHMHFEYPF